MIWLALTALIGFATLFAWCALAVAASAYDEVVEFEQLDALHHTPRNHGEGDGVGERVRHGASNIEKGI